MAIIDDENNFEKIMEEYLSLKKETQIARFPAWFN